jgi:hypothetical protein
MKKGLLLMGLSLFSVTISAQQIHSILNKKYGIENKTSIKTKQTRQAETEKQKEYQKMVETQVNTSIARHKLENMRETIERASVNLLDEAVIEGSERRTYTYSPDGKRDEEKLYHWYNNEWRLDNVYKRIYTYDDQQRCTGRTILDDGREISKVTISYEGGNTIYKYYRIGGPEQTLVADYEKGYDAEKRETLYKLYDERGILRDWREFRYDNEGDQVFTLFWNGSWGEHGSGTKYETIKEGLKNTRTSYQWDSNKNDWWMTETLTILHNEAKRSLSEERYAYNPDGSIIHGEKETNVYDAYNRLTSTVVEEYTNGKFEYSYKEEYTYWGTEAYDPDSEEEDFEGPLLTYSSSDWEDGEWVETEYGKIERNAQGVATKGYSKEIDEERIDGEYVFVINEEEGTFDDKGNLIASTGTCKHENGTLLYNIKSEYEYNAQNKNIRSTFYRKYPTDDAWQLNEEDREEYDSFGRTILSSYLYRDDSNNWQGNKSIYKYQFGTKETEYAEITDYFVNSNGEFSTVPSYFRSHLLKDQIKETINQSYENGVVVYGNKEEVATISIQLTLPDPERYNDPIEIEEVMESPEISLISSYYWENGSWIPQQKYGFEQEGNNITVTFQVGDREMERSVYTYDDQKRIVAYIQYQDTEKRSEVTYSYNNDGLLNKKDENGIVTLYIYSKHEVTGIEKTTVSVLQIKGRIITTDNAETLLQVYTIDGTLIASGTGTVTLPESRIYIVVTDTVRQKVMIQ